MAEYISREAVINITAETGAWETQNRVRELPSADVQPVIHAHWRRGEEKGFRTYNPLWYCSNCGGQIRYDTRMRQYQKIKRPVWEVNTFCRKCGARMEQED